MMMVDFPFTSVLMSKRAVRPYRSMGMVISMPVSVTRVWRSSFFALFSLFRVKLSYWRSYFSIFSSKAAFFWGLSE